MPASEAQELSRGRLLKALFWGGVGLVPLTILILMFGQSTGTLRVAVIFAVLAAVAIGVSLTLRRESESVRVELEQFVFEQVDQVRGDARADVTTAARNTYHALSDKVAALTEAVEVLRFQVEDALAQVHSMPMSPPAGGAVAPASSGPAGVVHRTETVHVTRRTTTVDTAADGDRGTGTVYGSRAALASDMEAVRRGTSHRDDTRREDTRRDDGRREDGRRDDARHDSRDAEPPPRSRLRARDEDEPRPRRRRAHDDDDEPYSRRDDSDDRDRRDSRDVRDGRDVRDSRDSRDVRDSRDGRYVEDRHRDDRYRDDRHRDDDRRVDERRVDERRDDDRRGEDDRRRVSRYRDEEPSRHFRDGLYPGDDRWEGVSSGDRWASVRDDDHGRELRVGERRSSMRHDEHGSEVRIVDRWAALRREESRGHRDDGGEDWEATFRGLRRTPAALPASPGESARPYIDEVRDDDREWDRPPRPRSPHASEYDDWR